MDQTSKPASIPDFANTKAPHKCPSIEAYSKSPRICNPLPIDGLTPPIAKSTLAHPQLQREMTRASASCGRNRLASGAPFSSIHWTRDASSFDSSRSSGIGIAPDICIALLLQRLGGSLALPVQFRVTVSLKFNNKAATCDHAACSGAGICSLRSDSPSARYCLAAAGFAV
jgi:hypothetical protein